MTKPGPGIGIGIAPLFALSLLLAACGGGDDGGGGGGTPPPTTSTPLTCAQLAGTTIPAASIGLPTSGATVISATVVAPTGTAPKAIPEHCLVVAKISPVDPAAPDIRFNLALPTDWNHKAVMFGGGGFDGSIPAVTGNVPVGPTDQPNPLGRGYATFASDSGHQANAFGSQDGSFALNDEAADNFGGDAIKKTRDAATFLIKARYAVDAVRKAYFAGGSTGGREALAAVTRWPADWDGAISLYPAWNDAAALLHGQRVSRVLSKPGAYPNTAKRSLIYAAAMEACDGLDGAVDGLISNQQRCNAVFDPATASVAGNPLRCPDGADTGDTCLSDAQITALKAMNTDTQFHFALASGETHYPGYNVWGADLGITTNPSPLQPTITFLALGTAAPATPMPRNSPYIGTLLDQWIKYSVTRDAGYDSLSFDPENPGPWANRVSQLSTLLDTRVDLDAFAAKGGKLLLAHGLADVLVSTRATEEYYQRLQARMGPSEVDTFVRYYEIPGLGHAVSTAFNAAWDSLTTLEHWAEDGTAPSAQVVADTAGVPGRTRPLCDYPAWPRYNGTGDVNMAASFTCANRENASPTQRSTSLGDVIGTDHSATSGTYAWKGIPYAKAPVGDLRWKAPAAPEPWTSPKATQQFGNACASFGRLYGPGSNNKYDATIGTTVGQPVGSEDCLYLNIWRPTSAATNLPVIVFVHGGSNVTGYTADPVYDGAALARTANAVVVTVNYRLGLLGFINLGQLKTGDALDDSGNFALLDILQALKFINGNVAAFGGNPGNVTLMGQSAGAVNVYALMTSPLVAQANPALVHRVIPISGGISRASELPAGSVATLASPSDFRGQADFLVANLVLADGLAGDLTAAYGYVASRTPEQVATYMRGKSAEAIINTVTSKLAPIGASGSGPIADGNVLPVSPIAAIQAGQYLKVPVLAGNTRDEGKLFPTLLPLAGGTGSGRLLDDPTVFAMAFNYKPNGPATTTIAQWIPPSYLPMDAPVTGFNARSDLLNRLFFLNSRDSVLGALQSQQNPIWYYRFDWDELPAPFNEIYGAAHAFDLPFAFGNFGPSLYANFTNTAANAPGRLALSDAMMRSIGAFARNGDPNNTGLGTTWPQWPATLVFDASLTAKQISVQ
ncbi:Carboxylesterase type B [Rhizobacter sp. OV335]|nr:Carboxylesterase type B [Rhizobacter sp. OV335]